MFFKKSNFLHLSIVECIRDLLFFEISHADLDYWVPIVREDGVENDWCEIGEHSEKEKCPKYITHLEAWGKCQWQESVVPHEFRPTEFIYVKMKKDVKRGPG